MGRDNARRLRALNHPERSPNNSFGARTGGCTEEAVTRSIPPFSAGHLGRGELSAEKGGDRKGHGQSAPLSISHFRGTEALGQISSDSQPQTNQSIYSRRTIQNGDASLHPPVSHPVRLGSYNRSLGRLLPYPDSFWLQIPVGLCVPESMLPIQGTPLRPEVSAAGFYPSSLNPRRAPQVPRPSPLHIPRRLVVGGQREISTARPPQSPHTNHRTVRIPDQLSEIQTHPNPGTDIPGSGHRPPGRESQTVRSENRLVDSSCQTSPEKQVNNNQNLASISRPSSEPSRPRSGCTAANETVHHPPSQSLHTGGDTAKSGHPDTIGVEVSHVALARPAILSQGQTSKDAPPVNNSDDGCIPNRLGRSLRGPNGVREVGTQRPTPPYQYSGTSSGVPMLETISSPTTGEASPNLDRQHHGSELHKSPGRNQVVDPERSGGQNLEVVSTIQHHDPSDLLAGRTKSDRGLSLPRQEPPVGVCPEPERVQDSGKQMESRNRPVCQPNQSSPSEVLLTSSRPKRGSKRRIRDRLEEVEGICIPPTRSNPSRTSKNNRRSGVGAPNRTSLAEKDVVPSNTRTPGRSAHLSPVSSRHRVPTNIRPSSSSSRTPGIDCVAALREKAKQAGLSVRSANFISKSRRDSTSVVYNTRLKAFTEWCDDKGVNPEKASLGSVADFLVHLFDKNLSLSTIKGYRSAIAAIHQGFQNGSSVSSAPELTKLIQAFFLQRPANKRLTPGWSLPAVLRALAEPPFEPLDKASLRHLAIKTAFLIAVASGQRRGTLHALRASAGHIRYENHGVRLIPDKNFIAKNQTAVSGSVEIFLPSLKHFSSITEDKVWCPVRSLKWYLDRTKSLRKDDSLFISSKEPHASVSSSTISKWLVEAIKAAGINALEPEHRPRAHDVRGIAASWALFEGVPTSDILRAAYWHSSNTFISCYLSDVVRGEERFALTSLRAASGSK